MNLLLQKFESHQLRIRHYADFLLFVSNRMDATVLNHQCKTITENDAIRLSAEYFGFDTKLIQQLQEQEKQQANQIEYLADYANAL